MRGFLNWLGAKPWRVRQWRYRVIYRHMRTDHVHRGRVIWRGRGRIVSAWYALTFPHTHADAEDE